MSVNPKSILFTWNKQQSSGIEFEEKDIILTKTSILIGKDDNTGEPVALTATDNSSSLGKVLKLVSDGALGVKVAWADDDAGHTQNTDTGTTSQTFQLHSGNSGPKLKADSATQVGMRNAADGAYVNVKGARFYVSETTPVGNDELTSKSYVDGLLSANDAMVFKGVAAIATVAALTTYQAGWTYRASDAGTFKGNAVEIGDLLIAVVDRAGSGNVNADWTVAQTNIDGAVTAADALDADQLVVGNTNKTVKKLSIGSTGQVLKVVGGIPAWANEYSYTHPTTNGNKHIPADGATTQILQWDSAGTAKWITVSGDVTMANGGVVTIANRAVNFNKLLQSAAAGLSVIGRSVNSAGNFSEISADNDKTALRRYGNTVGFGRIASDYLEIGANADVAVPTAYNVGAGTYVGQITFDGNFLYICITPGSSGTARWVRIPAAKVWSAS